MIKKKGEQQKISASYQEHSYPQHKEKQDIFIQVVIQHTKTKQFYLLLVYQKKVGIKCRIIIKPILNHRKCFSSVLFYYVYLFLELIILQSPALIFRPIKVNFKITFINKNQVVPFTMLSAISVFLGSFPLCCACLCRYFIFIAISRPMQNFSVCFSSSRLLRNPISQLQQWKNALSVILKSVSRYLQRVIFISM